MKDQQSIDLIFINCQDECHPNIECRFNLKDFSPSLLMLFVTSITNADSAGRFLILVYVSFFNNT